MRDLIPVKQSFIDNLIEWDDLVMVGQEVRTLKDVSQWYLGDLARQVIKKYGENSLGKYARDIGVNDKSLSEYRRVARYFPRKKDRIPLLSFSHHQRALKAEDPRKALLEAHDNDWSIKQFDRFLIEEKSADCKHDFKDFKICTLCGKKIPNLPIDKEGKEE